jgi:hypothetical protein
VSKPVEIAVEIKDNFMKTRFLKNMLLGTIVCLALETVAVQAQNAPVVNANQTGMANATAPQLSYGTSQILRLAQANVGTDTMIAYIKSSRNSYGLDASQIIYLRQQGIADAVITAMLNQPVTGIVATPVTDAPQPVAATVMAAPVATTTVAPTVTYVQTVPAPVYYYPQPYYYPYQAYSSFPAVSLSFAWGNVWHGGGYHGGWHH